MAKDTICRFCRVYNCEKDIFREYYYAGKIVRYSDLLWETFNVKIAQVNGRQYRICERCTIRLNDAAEFKKQVVKSEDGLFKEGLKWKDKDADIKLESDQIFDDYDFDDGDSEDIGDEDFAWTEAAYHGEDKGQIFVIKLENKNENESKFTKKMPTPKDLSPEPMADSILDEGIDTKSEDCTRRNIGITVKETPTTEPAKNHTSQTQIELRENTLKLIKNSNLCLFKSLKNKFGCNHCKQSFINITDLRTHAQEHTIDISLRINKLKGLSYKNADITNLACRICSESCSDLNVLMSHLEQNHSFTFKNRQHLLIPYKLENGFECVNCNQIFNTYMRLSVHMNTHYLHNVCEICGVSYINRISLRTHINSIHKEKRCSKCQAVFSTNHRRARHMRLIHNVGSYKRYCLLCDKTFRYTYMLSEHMYQDHGAKRPVSFCTECGKKFTTPQNLKIHIRSVHIRERNYACGRCEMRFFTKCDQKRHERTHEDIRSFACGLCEGRFKSKDSLRRHMRRQHGH